MIIEITELNGTIQISIEPENTGAKAVQFPFNSTIPLSDLKGIATEVIQAIEDVNLNNYHNYRKLKDICYSKFYKNLFPDYSIRELLEKSDNQYIYFKLSENLLALPFEALYDGTGFLSLDYPIAKKLIKDYKSHQTVKSQTNCDNQDIKDILLLFNPDSNQIFKSVVDKERTALKKTLSHLACDEIESINITIDNLKNSFWRYKLIYYSGHSTPSELILDDDKLEAEKLKVFNLTHCELIYLNSCSSLQVADTTENPSIIRALLENETTKSNFNVLGNITRVENEKASEMAIKIFKKLLEGQNIGLALKETRNELSIKYQNDANWLSLSYYGNLNWKLLSSKNSDENKNITKKINEDNEQNFQDDFEKVKRYIGQSIKFLRDELNNNLRKFDKKHEFLLHLENKLNVHFQYISQILTKIYQKNVTKTIEFQKELVLQRISSHERYQIVCDIVNEKIFIFQELIKLLNKMLSSPNEITKSQILIEWLNI